MIEVIAWAIAVATTIMAILTPHPRGSRVNMSLWFAATIAWAVAAFASWLVVAHP